MEFGIHTLYNFTNLNLFGRFYYPFIKKFHLFMSAPIRKEPCCRRLALSWNGKNTVSNAST